ncbi:copper-binding protein [Herbaspirillum sp. ST 5-3]|uniref:copper-binding protein n=1 Tax=Oxalobacteraceae TaxID=75682 RepID=UPI0010A4AAE2|nr:copper-binding protein [Herbaspirillum sp. ST 5-3]
MKVGLVVLLTVTVLSAGLSAAHDGSVECGRVDGERTDKERHETASKTIVHHAVAVVHTVNRDNGTVSVVHEPVKDLNWPAMTKAFVVEDRSLFDKLVVGKKVCLEFEKRKTGYVITAVK